MINFEKIKGKALDFKHKLPFEGDWLFVTFSNTSDDLAREDGEKVKEKIRNGGLRNNNYKIINQLNKFSNDRMAKIDGRSKLVREKAKLIWQSAGVIFTVFFTITGLLIKNFNHLAFSIKAIIFVLTIFMIFHLSRALKVSINVITREEDIIFASDNLIEIAEESENESDYLEKMTLEEINNSNFKNKFITKRVNKVIKAQISLVWGIIYLASILILIIGCLFFYDNNPSDSHFLNNKKNISVLSNNEKEKTKSNIKKIKLNLKKDNIINKTDFSLSNFKFRFDEDTGKVVIIKESK
ncbi:hypothetical protein BX659_11021 [Orenia metallireducens]|uniref:Uncharacterized protein n=1 Tax=Orenia metallireducens TaxID=1413210 RepID=A0A285HY45_9FIRM|nr:hypothetical protein [Orenia metallireducens]PRX29277.1 hypothetical protein BX659_11021 [Orenia metallireducens]SNY40625.1 hypothetical protein SAMN06265827_12721 [Orenia metallireducens]